MNETQWFWPKVRDAINKHPYSWAPKLSDQFTAGTPDCQYSINGVQGLLELKYVRAWPSRQETTIPVGLTAEQRGYLERWLGTRGRAHVLLGVEDMWFLLELREIPPAEGKKPPRVTRAQLAAVLEAGRGDTVKNLKYLPVLLAKQPLPVLH